MDSSHSTGLTLLLAFTSVAAGLYLISDYYMDKDFPSSFGMACGTSVQDDCLYVNSHFSYYGISNYDDDNECTLVLDAGDQKGARYKLKWQFYSVEWSPNCTNDYVALYNANSDGLKNVTERRFCGKTTPDFNATQQYITFRFKTDGSEVTKGFRVLATRTLPAPCRDGYFHCVSEDRCIDGRLHCDGTVQCDDRSDEDDCNFWEKLIGGFLALGIAGMIGVFILIVIGCTTVCVGYCACKKCCCKKRTGKVGDAPNKDHVEPFQRNADNAGVEKEYPRFTQRNARKSSAFTTGGKSTHTVDPWPGSAGDRVVSPDRSIDREVSLASLDGPDGDGLNGQYK